MTPKSILTSALTLTLLGTSAIAAPATEAIEFCGKTFKMKAKSVSCSGDRDSDERLVIADFSPLEQLERLSALSLARVEVGDLTSLSKLPKLRRLSIRDAELSAPSSLGEISNLRRLDIGGGCALIDHRSRDQAHGDDVVFGRPDGWPKRRARCSPPLRASRGPRCSS